MSISRLELTAALLLARCLKFIQESLSIEHIPFHCWTDSSVTLTWIQHHPSRWKSFVADWVYAIQVQLPNATWHYVFSASNPANLASRGVLVSNLANSTLWWKGPEWLLLSSDQWPIDRSSPPQNLPLIGRKISCFTSCHHAPYLGLSWAVFIMAKITTHHGVFNALYRMLAHDTTTTPGGGVASSCDRALS